MADKKPLKIAEGNDTGPKEFAAADSLGIVDGGTSAVTANAALNNLLPSQGGNAGKQLQTDGADTSWEDADDDQTKLNFEVSFITDSSSSRSISSSSYVSFAYFIFKGTDYLGLIDKIKLIAGVNTVSKEGSYKIIDITNSNNLIAELTLDSSDFPSIIDLGTLTNVPAGEAMFELQVRNDDVGNKVKVSSLVMESA